MLGVNALSHFARPHTSWKLTGRMSDQTVQDVDGNLLRGRTPLSLVF
jgi:hypothetical protein